MQAQAQREKQSALEDQENKLRQEGTTERQILTERLGAESAQAQEQAVSVAVAQTQQKADAALQEALSALRARHAEEAAEAEAAHAQQLISAAERHAADLESTEARLKEEAEADAVARVAACQAVADTHIAAANAAREQSLADQKNVEARYEVKMAQALETAEARDREQLQQYVESYSEERARRRAIHNKLLELQGNIRVLCRARPVLEIERRHASPGEEVDVTEFPSDADVVVQRDAHTKTKFEFDKVFTPASSQSQVFEHVQPLCVSVLDGYNVCIFAYGQTGA
jgi:kinesin family protein C2/C3